MMTNTSLKKMPFSFIIFLIFFSMHESLITTVASAPLEVGFYRNSCPSAERIVGEAVKNAVWRNPGFASGLIRLHFHDCFVRGCDASVLLDSTPDNTAEKDDKLFNTFLRGIEVIDEAKAKIEDVCPQTVSCADIVAFAARDSAFQVGNIQYQVPAGRRDGKISLSTEPRQNLPFATFNVSQLLDSFARKGLSADDMVILSGAHSTGVAHCSTFSDRLFSFNGTHSQDPSLDPQFATKLKNLCPVPSLKLGATSRDPTVPLDTLTPTALDNKYYVDLENNSVLLTSDQTLTNSALTAKLVRQQAENGSQWAKKFGDAMVRMGSIEVLTGNQGEIRRNCRVVN